MASYPSFEVIAGLGNPGPEYERTFHNAGFLAVEMLAENAPWKSSRDGAAKIAQIGEKLYVLPQTFMNLSGEAISSVLRYFKKEPESLLVVHDDTDLPLGEWKLEFGRGSAGHHGVDSVIQALGTRDIWRLRIGVRPAERAGEKAAEFVLSRISDADLRTLQGVFEKVRVILNETSSPLNRTSEG